MFGAWAFNVDFHVFLCPRLSYGFSAHESGARSSAEHPRFAAGAKRSLRQCEILPTLYRKLLPVLISKNLDDLLYPPVTALKCNGFRRFRNVVVLRGLSLCKQVANKMATTPAAQIDVSETHNFEFETQKKESETLLVQRESLSQE